MVVVVVVVRFSVDEEGGGLLLGFGFASWSIAIISSLDEGPPDFFAGRGGGGGGGGGGGFFVVRVRLACFAAACARRALQGSNRSILEWRVWRWLGRLGLEPVLRTCVHCITSTCS